jgi:hypothetical protein
MNDARQDALPTPWHTIHQAIFIYRANFPMFFRTGLQATGWLLVANLVLFLGPLLLIAYLLGSAVLLPRLAASTVGLLIFWGLLIGMPCLYILANAKGSLYRGFIGLVAYQMLTGQPESLPVIFRQIKPWMWRFWLLEICISISVALVAAFTSRLEGWWMLLGIALQILEAASFFISDIIMAVERCNVFAALVKGNRLSKTYRFPVICVLIITTLIVIPLDLLAFLPVIGVWLAEWQVPETALFAGNPVIHLLQALGISAILSTFVQVVTIPFWQLIKASLYRDLYALNFSQS